MAITISGENNNDRILASDGVIDQISGINFSGIITASHIDVGSNIQLGNAGIVTATTFIGNLTGNVNSSSNLLLQIGGSEKFRVGSSGQLGIGGANYGTSGQVLTSGGSGSAPTWSTINSDKITEGNTEAEVVDTGSDGHFKVTTEGTERLRVKADGTTHFYGNQTTAPEGDFGFRWDRNSSANFQITNTNNTSVNAGARITLKANIGNIYQQYVNNGGFYLVNSASGYLHYYTGGTSRLYIDSSGNVNINNAGTIGTGNGGVGKRFGIKSTANNILIGETTSSSNYGLIIESRQTGRSGGARCSQIEMGDGVISLHTAASGADVTQRLRITSDGNIAINGAAPNHDASSGSIFIKAPSGNPNRGVKWSDTSDTHYVKYESSVIDGLTINGYSGVAFATGSRTNSTWTERLRMDINGKLVMGHNSALTKFHGPYSTNKRNPQVQINGTTVNNASLSITSWDNNVVGYYGPALFLAKSGSSTIGTNSRVSNQNSILGSIIFSGDDGDEFVKGAMIQGAVDSGVSTGNNDMPGRLMFLTTEDGAQEPTERLRITNVGRVQINQTTNLTGTAKLEVMGTSDTSYPQYSFAIGVGDTRAYDTTNGPGMGIGFTYKHNSSGSYALGCGIRGFKENTTDGDYAGAMAFYTRPNGTGAGEKARLSSAGTFGVGTANPDSNYKIDCNGRLRIGDGNAGHRIQFSRSGLGDELVIGVDGYGSSNNNEATIQSSINTGRPLVLRTSNGDRLRIAANGRVGVFETEAKIGNFAEALQVRGLYSNQYAIAAKINQSSGSIMRFSTKNPTNGNDDVCGSITGNGTSCSFNTSSDYRLKENDVKITDGITRIKQLRPIKFNWKTDSSSTQDGFFAHEVQPIVPESVTGEKDAEIDEIGEGYQKIDHSKLIPLLTAALQEAITEIETLKTKVDALEGS